MNIFLGLIGIIGAIAIIKYREAVGDIFGAAGWTKYFGGPYAFAIFVGIVLFFFSLAKMTGTTEFLLSPLKLLFPFTPQE